MNFDMNILKSLCLSGGISGNESEVREKIVNEISKCDIEYYKDPLGNLIVFKKGKNRPLTRLMLTAHMDEVGLIVTHITEDGYLGFDKVGGIDNKILLGQNVFVGKNKIPGVIGIKPIHLAEKSEVFSEIDVESLLIDIGAKNRENAQKYVNLGDSVIFSSTFDDSNGRIISKALDDRVGCFILINMIKNELEYDTYFVFTVQEEIGLRGAKTAAYTVSPQAALVIEATTANEVPGTEEYKKICQLGKGPAVSFMDKRTLYDKEYYDLAISLANENGINIQPKKGVTGGNDAGAINISKEGVRTLALSVPCRYLHTNAGIINKTDLMDTFKLSILLTEKIASQDFNSKVLN